MKKVSIVLLFFSLMFQIVAQDPFGLEDLKLKSNDFAEYVMSQGRTLNEKLPINLVPNDIADFNLQGQDSLAMEGIKSKFVMYYDYLISYQKKSGISENNLASIFVESAATFSIGKECIIEWYETDVYTIAVTLACYQSDIDSVKESCIARSIQATIINNANVAECFKALDEK